MKIGELVRHYAVSIFEYCETNDPGELARLQDLVYSKKQFGVYHPFCREEHNVSEQNTPRYWAPIYYVQGKKCVSPTIGTAEAFHYWKDTSATADCCQQTCR